MEELGFHDFSAVAIGGKSTQILRKMSCFDPLLFSSDQRFSDQRSSSPKEGKNGCSFWSRSGSAQPLTAGRPSASSPSLRPHTTLLSIVHAFCLRPGVGPPRNLHYFGTRTKYKRESAARFSPFTRRCPDQATICTAFVFVEQNKSRKRARSFCSLSTESLKHINLLTENP